MFVNLFDSAANMYIHIFYNKRFGEHPRVSTKCETYEQFAYTLFYW